MGHRRKARELALQILFQYDLTKGECNTDEFLKDKEIEEDIKEFAINLKNKVIEHLPEIDAIIKRRQKDGH